MSQDEQDLIFGRLMRERKELTGEIVALREKLKQIEQAGSAAPALLASFLDSRLSFEHELLDICKSWDAFPSTAILRQTLSDYQRALERLREVEEAIK